MESIADHLTGEQLKKVDGFINDFVQIHGLVMNPNNQAQPIPLTMLPSPFPHKLLQFCMKIQKDFNLLYHKVACDHDFLQETLQCTLAADDFMAKLWNIYETVRNEGLAQPIFLGLNRSDYMLDWANGQSTSQLTLDDVGLAEALQVKQVEFNLMASSFGGLMQQIIPFHRMMLRFVGHNEAQAEQRVPWNAASDGFAKGLLSALKIYDNPEAAILFIVMDNEINVFDQRFLERSCYALNPDVKILRYTFESLAKLARLTENRTLMVDDVEIGIVYFRIGYVPEHYHSQEAWEVKLLLERSRAIKCPCIQYMLANTKRIQMALCNPGVIQRYIPDLGRADNLAITFVGQYDLSNRERVEDALANPDKYVLKTQREGGGNNFFRDGLKNKLNSIRDPVEGNQYILMERIRPPTFNNYIHKAKERLSFRQMISELGIYGVFIGAGETVNANYQCGHLLRSKLDNTDEGGIATGYAYLDSPYLI